jgi:uncharacterized protein (DUF697 family)
VLQQSLGADDQLLDSAATVALHPFPPADGLMLSAAQAFIILLVTFA